MIADSTFPRGLLSGGETRGCAPLANLSCMPLPKRGEIARLAQPLPATPSMEAANAFRTCLELSARAHERPKY